MCIICNQGFFDSTMLKQTSVLPFKNIKSCFFNNRRMKGRATVRGGGRAGGLFPQKILKSWCSETSFLVFVIHIFIFELSRTSSRLYFIIRTVFGSFLDILCLVSLNEYHKNSFENFRTDFNIGISPIPLPFWPGFRIFDQNRKNPDEIRMVRQSAQTYYFLWHSEALIGAMCTKNKQHLIQEQHYQVS